MNRCMLLLVTALVALYARGETLPARAAESDSTLSSLTLPSESHAVAQTAFDAKRSLRALETTKGAYDEEERDLSGLVKKVQTWVSNTKLFRTIARKVMQVKAKQRVNLIKKLAEKNYDNLEVIYRNKITPDEYFEAMGFHYSLRFARKAQIDRAAQHTPGLRKWDNYEKLYYKRQPKAS